MNVKYLLLNNGEDEVLVSTVTSVEVQLDLSMAILKTKEM